ncbi:MAG TPA: hypothetical protein VMD91_00450 [Candidatus Sulfotelmatobacter sp.]|nr:hypothetical protein [Candidatus Sulfotelmatobacter sp.]
MLLMVLAAELPVAAAAATNGAVAITIPLPVQAQLTFGQRPVAFFRSPTTLCFAKGVQRSLTLATAIQPKQLTGVPVCPPR